MNLDHLLLYDKIAQCVTLKGVAKNKGRHPTEEDLGVIEDAALVVDTETNKIVWVGSSNDLPREYSEIVNTYSGEGEVWLPELVDCHTHLVYGGDRFHDYSLRCKGMTYQEVAAAGGGILSTIRETREASFESLLESAQAEIERFQKYGVGTIEIKSGYGLDLRTEINMDFSPFLV